MVRQLSLVRRPPLVIFITSGRLFRTGNSLNMLDDLFNCTSFFNKKIIKRAKENGYAIFDREELERRFLYKSEHESIFKVVEPAIHLPTPVPQIIATALLSFITCLTTNTTESIS